MGYGDDLQPMMLGEITTLQPSFPTNGPPTLSVSGYDRSYELRHNQPDRRAVQVRQRQRDRHADRRRGGPDAGRGSVALLPRAHPADRQRHGVPAAARPRELLRRLRALGQAVLPVPAAGAARSCWSGARTCRASRHASPTRASRRYRSSAATTSASPRLSSASPRPPTLGLDDLLEKLGSETVDTLISIGRSTLRKEPVRSQVDAAGAREGGAAGAARRTVRGKRCVHRHAGAPRRRVRRRHGRGQALQRHVPHQQGHPHDRRRRVTARRSRSPSGSPTACCGPSAGRRPASRPPTAARSSRASSSARSSTT